MHREVQFVRAVGASYGDVRDVLRDRAQGVLGLAGEPPRLALVTGIGSTHIARDVAAVIEGFSEVGEECRLSFSGDTALHPDLSAHFAATVDAVPISDVRTAVFLRTGYEPPLGPIGGALDSLGLHRLFAQALEEWFDGFARRLGEALHTG